LYVFWEEYLSFDHEKCHFSLLYSGRLARTSPQHKFGIVVKRSIPDWWIFIVNVHSESEPMKCDFQTHADVNKTILLTLTDRSEAHTQRCLRLHAIPILHIYTELQYFKKSVLASIHVNIICYVLSEHLVNCWGKTSDV